MNSSGIWGIKFPNENVKTIDLALVRIERNGRDLSGYQEIVMEFKYPWFLTDSAKRIANDITKLTRLMNEVLADYLPLEEDNLRIINKGHNPAYAFLFVIYGGEEKTDSFNFYNQFRNSPVEILVAYPDSRRVSTELGLLEVE